MNVRRFYPHNITYSLSDKGNQYIITMSQSENKKAIKTQDKEYVLCSHAFDMTLCWPI